MSRGAIIVGPSAAERVLVWVGFPVVGAGVGWLLQYLAGWVASLPWAPFQGPFKLVASIADRPWATAGAIALGVVAGMVVALLAENDYVTVTVEDDHVTIAHGDSSRDVTRAPIDAVFLDGKQLVVLGRGTEELAREGGDLPARDRLESAFRSRGYPWRPDGDPHHDAYRRWVEDAPGLPEGADALLRARARALDKGDEEAPLWKARGYSS